MLARAVCEAAPSRYVPAMAPSNRSFKIDGRTLGYPTEFRDGQSAQGLFLVDAFVANALIVDSGFRVAEVAPGCAVLSLNCVHYTDTDCGTYLETAQAFFVEKVGVDIGSGPARYLRTWIDVICGDIASFTWALQVDTLLAQQAGIQMWGFPKTIDHIEMDMSKNRASFTLNMDGLNVFKYSVRAEGKITPPPLATPVYSIFEGVQQVGTLSQQYSEASYRPGGGTLQLGDHPMADKLRSLGLPKRPIIGAWTGHLAFSMSAPDKL